MIGMVEDVEETVDPWWSWEPGQRKLAPAGGVKVLYIRGEQRENILPTMKSLLQRWNTTYEGEQVLLDPDRAFIGNWLWFSSAYPDVGDRWYLFVEGLCYVITNEGIEIQGHFPDKPSSFFGNGIFRYYQRADKPGLGTPQGFEGNVYYDIYQQKPIHLFAINDESWQKPIRDLFKDSSVAYVVPVYMPSEDAFSYWVGIGDESKGIPEDFIVSKKPLSKQSVLEIPKNLHAKRVAYHKGQFYFIDLEMNVYRLGDEGAVKLGSEIDRFLHYKDRLYAVEIFWRDFIELSTSAQAMAVPKPNETTQ